MRSFLSIATTFILFFLFSVSGNAQDLSVLQWQEDLDYLQKTVHDKHHFLFKKISKVAWDNAVDSLKSNIPNLQPHEIKVSFARLVAMFEYGHTQIPYTKVAEEGVLPVNLYHFSDGIYVEGVHKNYRQLLGARLINIGGMPVKEALQKIKSVVPAENDSYFKAYGLDFLTIPAVLHAQGVIPNQQDSVSLTVKKGGKTTTINVEKIPMEELSKDYGFTTSTNDWLGSRDETETPLYLKKLTERLYYFEYLPSSNTMYVRQSSVFNDEKEPLQDFYKRLFKAVDSLNIDKLVYDVRLNGGGNNYNNKALIKAIMSRPRVNQPGHLFYLIGRRTFSAAQNLTNEIKNYTEAIIVGEPTAENINFFGDAKRLTLPNSKINVYLSFAWWQDMPQWENQDATIPHLAAEISFNDYVTNRDPVLETAINYTEGAFVLDPMKHLTQLFTAGKLDQLVVDAKRIVKDPAYKYNDFEDEFSKTAYRLFQSGDRETGLIIYGFVAEVFPQSQAAWNNLASAFEQIEQYEKAIKAYEKAVNIDTISRIGKNAAQKIIKLKEINKP
ncbi:peptidase S41 [Gangjinia marincola]|uniref:Peptidase S41 n=1 Tax=Gangjinia marincola TaxID=578463 RepID=A0ABN1MDG5_9FLAO